MRYSRITWKLWVASLLLSALPTKAEVNLAPEVTKLHSAFDAQWQQKMQSNLAALDSVLAIDLELLDSVATDASNARLVTTPLGKNYGAGHR